MTFGFLAVMTFSQAIFTWKRVRETRCKTLEEMKSFGHKRREANIGAAGGNAAQRQPKQMIRTLTDDAKE